MLILLSPSKALDFETPVRSAVPPTQPQFASETALLLERMRRAGKAELQRLMDISDALAELNRQRYQMFETAPERPCVLAFDGDVYTGLQASQWSDEDLLYAQQHLRILSGLYGLLRPLDAIRPYRLEMGKRLDTARGATLYEFWGVQLADALETDLADHSEAALVNLASDEYFSAVDRKRLRAPVITPVFKDIKDGQARALFMYLKRARGRMAQWIIRNRIAKLDDLRDFADDGYRFDAERSNDEVWCFSRPQPASANPARRKR